MKPLAIDLFCGLGGWTDGLLAEGWDVIGFDIERHVYGEHRYPAQLVIQDVPTLHGAQFRNADLIVASPPCQAYSYRAMPWSRAKALPPPDNTLFEACFRIQREAIEATKRKCGKCRGRGNDGGLYPDRCDPCDATGYVTRHIPLIVENVRGAQKWVGRSRWNYGSFHLWGDVPALMPMTKALPTPWPFDEDDRENYEARRFAQIGTKNNDGSWFNVAHNTTSGRGRNPDGRKAPAGTQWFNDGPRTPDSLASSHSKSPARKAASAMIAKIPLPLARHIGRVFYPTEAMAA